MLHRMGCLGASLLIATGCGRTAPPPLPQVTAPKPASPARPDPVTIRTVAPDRATFRYHQRLRSNNYWDEGKPIEADLGRKILALLDGAVEWRPEERPGETAAWGQHAHAPPFVSSLRIRSGEKEEGYTFCYTLGLFTLRSQDGHWVVPDRGRAELTRILTSLGDPDRQPVAH